MWSLQVVAVTNPCFVTASCLLSHSEISLWCSSFYRPQKDGELSQLREGLEPTTFGSVSERAADCATPPCVSRVGNARGTPTRPHDGTQHPVPACLAPHPNVPYYHPPYCFLQKAMHTAIGSVTRISIYYIYIYI